MIYLFFMILIIVFVLFTDVGLLISINDTKFTLHVILFNVIKINIKAKNKVNKKNKIQKKHGNKNVFKNYEFISFALHKVKKLISKLKIELFLNCSYGFDRPDITAVSFGLLNSFIYPALKILQNSVKKFKTNIKITPDMKKSTYNLKANIYVRIKTIYIIIFALNILYKLFKIKKKTEVDK